eukprot:289683-Prymnesium_polylepis.1
MPYAPPHARVPARAGSGRAGTAQAGGRVLAQHVGRGPRRWGAQRGVLVGVAAPILVATAVV